MNETNDIANQVPVKCEICGRQDDTVRFVTYPYVFSFVVVTFQRAFTGCWCRLHRIQRWFAASIITSIFGWLGIPFGIVLTPIRLLQLARGGLLDNNVNGQILCTIGEQKLQNGDTQGAIRCFEASIMYADDPWVNEQLRNLYRSRASDNESPSLGLISMFVFPSIAIVFVLIGMFVGVLDFIVRWLSSFLPPELSIFVLILLQVPFMILVYFGVSFLSYVFQSVIRLTRISSASFLSIAGLVISLLFINGIVSGGTYGQYFNYFVNGIREQPDEIFTTLAAILTRGGPYIFNPAFFASNFFGSALFAVLIFLSFVLIILVLMPTVKTFAVQQDRIARLKSTDAASSRTSPMFGWIGLIGLIVVFALLLVATPQKSSIDALEAFDHIVIASGHMNSGEYDKAMSEYQSAIELKPNLPLGYIGLGYAYYFFGDLEQAKGNFELALSFQPDSEDAHSGLGWVYFHWGRYDLAGEEFNKALVANPQYLDSHLGLGWVYLREENYDLAGKEFEYVKSISPELPDPYLGLGILELSVFDYDGAIEMMDEALRLNSNMPGAYYYKGLAFYGLGRYSEADSAFKSALKYLPNDYDVLSGLGDVQVANYEFENGVEYYDKAIGEDPERMDAYLDKASVLIQMGEFDQAISLIEGFAEVNPKVNPTLAYIHYLKNEEIAGDNLYQSSTSYLGNLNDFERAEIYVLLAGIDYAHANFPEAKEHLDLIAENYMNSNVLFFMARIYSSLGEFDIAGEYIQRGRDMGHSEVSLHLAMAYILIDQGKLNEAYKELQNVLHLDDESSNAYALLSFVYYQEGNLPRASFAARTALNLNPYNAYAHAQSAFVYHAQGNIDVALREAQEAVRLNTLEDTSHYVLGVCYMDSGMPEEAISEFEKFLKLYWDRAYVREYKVKADEYLEQLRQSP
jgi:tetratricopeptide (TPR) repeat protein